MTVIHIISTKDTMHFAPIYNDLYNETILINPDRETIEIALKNEQERIIIIGHGTEYGLLDKNLKDYLIDEQNVSLLKNKNVIGIWCNASTFASIHNIEGFFTSMFLSNFKELAENCIKIVPDITIYLENTKFAKRIQQLIKENVPTTKWSKILQNMLDIDEHQFVKYNYEALYSTDKIK